MSEQAFPQNEEYGRITQEAIDRIRARTGKRYPIEHPFVRHVNRDSINHVARAIGDDNPLWNDPEHARQSRYGKLVAPPALLYAAAWGSWDLRRGQGLPGVHGLHSSDRWIYYRPLLEGDEVRAVKEPVSLEERKGAYAARSMMQTDNIWFYNQRDELVALQVMSAVRAEREDGKKSGKYTQVKTAVYTDEEIEEIDREIEAEEVRGAQPRYWEDVNVGDRMQPIVRGPLTVSDMIAWMMGIGSPHIRSGRFWLAYRQRSPKVAVKDPVTRIPQAVERVHWDPYMAAEIGMPSAYDYGSQRGGWASHFLTNWAGDDAWVAECFPKYRGMNFIGDTLRIRGEITDKWTGRSGIGYVSCKFDGISQRGENIMPGTGVIALPKRGQPLPAFPIDAVADRPEGASR
jgi:acyl dehydratase